MKCLHFVNKFVKVAFGLFGSRGALSNRRQLLKYTEFEADCKLFRLVSCLQCKNAKIWLDCYALTTTSTTFASYKIVFHSHNIFSIEKRIKYTHCLYGFKTEK